MPIDDFTGGRLCRIVTIGTGQDVAGGIDGDPYTVLHDNVPVTVREQGGSNDPRNDKRTQISIGRLYFTEDYGLTTRCEVQLLDSVGQVERTLAIVNTANVMSMGRIWQVDYEEVTV